MNNIIEEIIGTVSKHVGDDFLKSVYAISLLSPGINNVEEPIHIHIWGTPESGKTDLQTRFLELVPKEHKDVASDFSPRVLMRSEELKAGSIISMNDKIFTDPVCTLLNQLCDSTSWRKGRICATIVGSERVNLTFPPRVIFWMNSNRKVSDYSLREVDPAAVEGRFLTFQKDYTTEQKKNIFVKRNVYKEENNEDKIEEIRKYINDIYEHPITITCSEECRDLIWKESLKMDVTSIRIIGRYLTMCQVMALVRNSTEVCKEDIETVFKLLKTEEKIEVKVDKSDKTNMPNIIEAIEEYLPTEEIFNKMEIHARIKYCLNNIQEKFNTFNVNVNEILETMEKQNTIKKVVMKAYIGGQNVPTTFYYLTMKQC